MFRDMIDSSDDKSMTQGTIFNCAECETYPDDETLGLIITARCDIGNENKVAFYNFIPAIPYNAWKKKELAPIIKKRNLKDLKNRLSDSIKLAGFSESNVSTYGYDRVYEKIIENKKTKKNEIAKIDELKNKIDCLEDGSNYDLIASLFKKEIKKIIDDIISNAHLDYFFIDNIVGYGSVIVNLRDIYQIESSTALNITSGIEIDEHKNIIGIKHNKSNNFCSVVGQMKSPYIELLMQRFAHNFIRVGVDDAHKSMLSSIIGAE